MPSAIRILAVLASSCLTLASFGARVAGDGRPLPAHPPDPIRLDAGPEEAREHWAWRPPRRPALPAVRRAELVRDPLDRFVLARLEQAGLEPNPPATDRELVRRAYFDLLGLPPTYAEVEAYVDDPAPDKWATLVEELLERPEYGERWGRRWLDVVRYAQTHGYERDAEKPYAFGYRDYVIRSFASDKPYDRFLFEQLAGDELDTPTRDSLIATGFYRLGSWDGEPDDPVQAEMDELDDMLGAIGEGMLGLTVTCARCHDHLTDPISQEDYSRLLAFLRNITRWSRPVFALDSDLLRPWAPSGADLASWEAERQDAIAEGLLRREERLARARAELLRDALADRPAGVREVVARPASLLSPRERELIEEHLEHWPSDAEVLASLDGNQRRRLFVEEFLTEELAESFEGRLDWMLVVTEREQAEPTHVMARGSARSPMAEVEPGFPAFLAPDEAARAPRITPRLEGRPHSGRRHALAEWIASPRHPTTARVMTNRVWQSLLGRGIVATPNDFGVTGAAPTHPELLDWLAVELVEQGWSLKALQRRILGSYTYRMSSQAANERALELDPDNELFWRQELRRLDAETLRDTLLAVSGDLDPEPGGRGFFPLLAPEVLGGASKPGEGWELSAPEQRRRRSIYTFVKRGMLPPLLEAFDLADPNLPIGTRPTTTTATQALTLLNDRFVSERAQSLAGSLAELGQDDSGTLPSRARARLQVRELWRRALARDPSPEELRLALEHLEHQARSAELLRPALVFDPQLPPRLELVFLESLPDAAFLEVPSDDWRVRRGRWANEYNDTREVDLDASPAALLAEPRFVDGVVRLSVTLGEGCEVAGFLLRADEVEGEPVGIEFVLDAVAGECRWVELGGPGGELEVLARAPLAIEHERPFELVLELHEASARARIDGVPVLGTARISRREAGLFGLRTWGAALEVERLLLSTRAFERAVEPPPSQPTLLALESLCLVVLNLNELLYVD